MNQRKQIKSCLFFHDSEVLVCLSFLFASLVSFVYFVVYFAATISRWKQQTWILQRRPSQQAAGKRQHTGMKKEGVMMRREIKSTREKYQHMQFKSWVHQGGKQIFGYFPTVAFLISFNSLHPVCIWKQSIQHWQKCPSLVLNICVKKIASFIWIVLYQFLKNVFLFFIGEKLGFTE